LRLQHPKMTRAWSDARMAYQGMADNANSAI